MRFQQNTGPVMAKGVEDTVFYNFNRLVALNEVGGDPGRFGITLEQFHDECRVMQDHWARSMTSTTTHDTKRSEDVRARISLLAEDPGAWWAALNRWSRLTERHRQADLPDRNAEYLLYQILLGAWPISVERATEYMLKATREAKAHTSWNENNETYETALKGFIAGIMEDQAFLADFEGFVTPLVEPGRINSLAQTAIKLMAPGVPDIYQGNELWDLSLVDPDNRRPVDYDVRRALLTDLAGGLSAEQILARSDEGLPKMWVTRQVLGLRKRRPECFGPEGTYTPLVASGSKAIHMVGFLRGNGCACVVPRLPIRLKGDWAETSVDLPAGRWVNELTGEEVDGGKVPLATLLARFPVAILSRGD